MINIQKQKVHFIDNQLLDPPNPVSVNLIGAGGTGSQILTALARMNHALTELGHPGLWVRLWDRDVVTQANLGRQLFAESESGLYKSTALINRTNRFFGTNCRAETRNFEKDILGGFDRNKQSIIYISCVDSVQSRFNIAEILTELKEIGGYYRSKGRYWIDFGNSQLSGQVLLSTIGKINQPDSEKFDTVESLPFVTDEFGDLLKISESQDDTPSCSLAEALEKQDLYINSTLAQMGTSLLWSLFRNGFIENKGFFLNLKTFQSQPIKVA